MLPQLTDTSESRGKSEAEMPPECRPPLRAAAHTELSFVFAALHSVYSRASFSLWTDGTGLLPIDLEAFAEAGWPRHEPVPAGTRLKTSTPQAPHPLRATS